MNYITLYTVRNMVNQSINELVEVEISFQAQKKKMSDTVRISSKASTNILIGSFNGHLL